MGDKVQHLRNEPKLRFSEFTDVWEQRRFRNVFHHLQNNSLSRAMLDYEEGEVLNVHYGDILVEFGECLDIRLETLPRIRNNYFGDKYRASYLDNGDVIIADAAEDETVGKCCEIKGLVDEIILSGLHTIPCRPLMKFATGYLGYFMNSNAYHDQLLPLMQGTKVNSISKSAIVNTHIKYPKDIKEQEKIGQYFIELDNLINLHQRKTENLKLFKRGVTQKLFPSRDERIPKLRIGGFSNDWKLAKIGDLLAERNKKSPKSDEYPLMSFVAYEGVKPKGERFNREFLVNDENGKKYKKTEFGDFIYSSNNLTTGSIGLNRYGKATISPVYSIFSPTEMTTPDFISSLLVRPYFIGQMIRYRQGVVYGQWRIHESDFLKMSIRIPELDEQQEIQKLLKYLDKKINTSEKQLENLKQFKKGLLQQMFV